MADNTTIKDAADVTVSIASDDVGSVQFQKVKLDVGGDGATVPVVGSLPVSAQGVEDLSKMLMRLVKQLESNAVVDAAQRQRITLDAISAALTLATVTTVGTVSTVSAVSNIAANAGMDREQYINVAKQTYANSIRSRLSFL
jgi:hypothetical protein